MWQQLPPCRHEPLRIDASGLVNGIQAAVGRVVQHHRPHNVAIAPHDGVRPAETLRLRRIERRVNAAEDDRRSSSPSESADLVAAKCVARVNPYSHDVARLNQVNVQRFKGFVGDARPSMYRWSRPGEDEQPSRCDHTDAEGEMARVHQMDSHRQPVDGAVSPESFLGIE
jgi:hypothetical protein